MNSFLRMRRHIAVGLASALTYALGSCLAMALPAPRILQVDLAAHQALVTVSVPDGVRRIVLESCNRQDLKGWTPRVVQRVDGNAQTLTLSLPVNSPSELIRVRADATDPIPEGFYQGATNVAPIALRGDPGTAYRGLGTGPDLVLGNEFNTPGIVNNNSSVDGRSVVESDIWQRRGSRLLFFNQLRGLQVIDISQPDSPTLRGVLPMPAVGEQLYMLDDHHAVLLIRTDCGGNDSAAVVVDVESTQPREISRVTITGDIHESRLVGTALYVASRVYRPSGDATGNWQLETVLAAIDLSNPDVPVARPEQRLPGSVSAVTADNGFFYIAATQYTEQWTSTTQVHVFDITSPDGAIAPFAVIKVPGTLRDKFKIHRHDDILRLVVEDQAQPNAWSPITRLLTVRLDRTEQDNHRVLGRLDLGPGENLFATRFDGQRAYVVTYRRTDPLWIVDLSDPTAPKIAGELHIPGWSNYIHPLGDRLVTVGIDDTANWKTAVQLFDVSDPAKPALLSKIPLGDQWSWSEANQDEKALGVFPDDGLILIPFSGSSATSAQQAVQLIDLKPTELVRRGLVSHNDLTPRRATLFQDRVFSLSQRELLSVDISNRDQPAVKGHLDLSRRVDRIVAAGSHLLSFTDGDLSVVKPESPDTILARLALGPTAVLGVEVRDQQAYVLQGTSAQTVWSTTNPTLPDSPMVVSTNSGKMTLRVLDLSALPEIREVGQTSWEHSEFTGNDFVALWPTPGTLVWSARHSSGGYPIYLFGGDILLPPTARFAFDVAPSITVTAPDAGPISLVGVDPSISLPFGRFWWPGFWYGQRQILFACDVSNPTQPAFRSVVLGDSKSLSASKAHAADGLVFFSDQFQESEIIGTNRVVGPTWELVTTTNSVLVTNIVAIPRDVWATNLSGFKQVFNAVDIRWPTDLPKASAIAAGAFHSLLTDDAGDLWSWGNLAGRSGPDAILQKPSHPLRIPGAGPFAAAAASTRLSVGVDTSGQWWHWRAQPASSAPPLPDEIPGSEDIDDATVRFFEGPIPTVISGGHSHFLALVQGRVWGWGENERGSLGQPAPVLKLTVPSALGNIEARAVAAGAYHSLAIDLAGNVLAWGANSFGQLGSGDAQDHVDPQMVLSEAVAVAAGAYHSVALKADGTVWAWGRNLEGQLGRFPTFEQVPKPLPVDRLPSIRSIAASAFATFAIDAKGQVWQWGQLDAATGPTQPFPAQIQSLFDVRQIATGRGHAIALGENGELTAWGSNSHGQLGEGEARVLVAVGESFEVIHDYAFDYETNVISKWVTESRWIETQVTNEVPIYRWWQRYTLNVVDYSTDAASPTVRPALDLPGSLEGIANNGNLLFTVGHRPDNLSTVNEQDVLQVSAYDGTKIFLGDSRVIANTLSNETALVRVLKDGRFAILSGGWSEGATHRIELFRLENARFVSTGAATLPAVANAAHVLDNLLVLRDAVGVRIFDVTGPEPVRRDAIDLGCIGIDLDRITGDAVIGIWAAGSDYGALRLGPR